jgi:hypothetical protein
MSHEEIYKKNVCSTFISGATETSTRTLLSRMGEKRSLREHSTSESSCSIRSIKITNIINDTTSSSSASSSQHHSSSSIEKLDDNFFGAFQEHYEYLMDKGLIETCQVNASVSTSVLSSVNVTSCSNGISSSIARLQNGDENLSGNVSFKEFLHQYNELNKWLEQMLSFNSKTTSSHSEKYTNQVIIF